MTENTPPDTNKKSEKSKTRIGGKFRAMDVKKRRVLIFFGVILGLIVILLPLYFVDFTDGDEDTSEQTSTYYTYPSEWFAKPVYDTSVLEDPEYRDLNTYMAYKWGNETCLINSDAENISKECVFWDTYFKYLKNGDSEGLTSLHSEYYIDKFGGFDTLAPQKVYDILVELMSSEYLEEGDANGEYVGCTVSYFKVSYCILDNNGTFRKDILDDDVQLPLIYEVITDGSLIYINNYMRITSASNVSEKEGFGVMPFVWAAVVIMAIVVELFTTSLVSVWFVPGAIVSFILAMVLPGSELVQIIVFLAVTVLCLILSKTVFSRFMKGDRYSRTNADRVVGMSGIVTEKIDNIAMTGEVHVDGKRWSARSEDGSVIDEGKIVVVLRIEGVKLICKISQE